MATIGRNVNFIGYGRSGAINLTQDIVFEEPTQATNPVIEETTKNYFINQPVTTGISSVETTTDTSGNTVLIITMINGDIKTTVLPTLPITVNEAGKIVMGGSVIVDGDIETSTESGQIIGDTKDTILEDIDCGTF